MSQIVSAFDVAAYILKKSPHCTHMKLQKLLYYSQAWSLVWDEVPLFRERIEAWANGPVVPDVFQQLKGSFAVTLGDLGRGDPSLLSQDQAETIDGVMAYYGNKTAQWLSDLTHAESPWIEARRGIPPGERGSSVITPASMAEYYGTLVDN